MSICEPASEIVMIYHFPMHITESQAYHLAARCGSIQSFNYVTSYIDGQSCLFVRYHFAVHAQSAVLNLNDCSFRGHPLAARFLEENERFDSNVFSSLFSPAQNQIPASLPHR